MAKARDGGDDLVAKRPWHYPSASEKLVLFHLPLALPANF